MTDAPPQEPKILEWIPEVAPERARRLRTGVLALLLGSSGLFSAGLLTGAWSVSKGYPDFRILRTHAQVRVALDETRALRQKQPGPPPEKQAVDLLERDIRAVYDRLDDLEPLHRSVPALRAEGEAVLLAVVPFYTMRNEAYLHALETLNPRMGKPSTPAAQLQAAEQGLRDLEAGLSALDLKMRALYPWLEGGPP